MADILVLNAGSSSIKFKLFDAALTERLSGSVTGIGGVRPVYAGCTRREVDAPDHAAALRAILEGLSDEGVRLADLGAAAHRVVHGGAALTAPARLSAEVIAGIEACIPLAPLHNPHNLGAIRALAAIAPDLPQTASFDTAFHATNPDVATRYAVPPAEAAKGIRRYGFHGISYAGLVAQLPGISGLSLPSRLLALHLGNGASLCAIRDGRSVATTMGYSPLSGLTMGTRSGDIDGNAVLRLAAEHGIERAARILNHESGLLGLGGESDMRALRAAGTPEADFAIRHFCHWAIRHAGSMVAAMGGLDAIAFTGGIGENDPGIRHEIVEGLSFLGARIETGANAAGGRALHAGDSAIPVWIVPADEERMIARDALSVLGS